MILGSFNKRVGPGINNIGKHNSSVDIKKIISCVVNLPLSDRCEAVSVAVQVAA